MARTKKPSEGEETTEQESNFQNLPALKAEFKANKMPEPKLRALKKKLIGHFTAGESTEEEDAFMEEILKKGNLLRTLSPSEKYLFNAIEYERCSDVAIVKTDDVPVVHHLKKDLACRFFYDEYFDDGKGKPDSIGRFHVYVPRTIPTRHQLSVATVIKEDKGHPIDPSEYPEPKIVIHHIILKQAEFARWFEVQDPDILTSEKKEEIETASYKF